MYTVILVGQPEENTPLGIPRRRSEDNIKTYLQEVSRGFMHWIHLLQEREC